MVGTHKVRTYPPIATMYIEFFFCGNMGVVFVRQSVHLADHSFSATQFEHGLSEPCITDESIVNVLVFSFYALLLELICRVVFFTTFFLPVPVTVWPALPDVKVRDREEIKNGLDVLLVFCCIISQEVARTCSRRCQRPNTSGMLCIVLSALRRLSRIVQCSQQL